MQRKSNDDYGGSLLTDLPGNVLLKIFCYLNFKDFLSLKRACQLFYHYSRCKEFYEKVQINGLMLHSGKYKIAEYFSHVKYGSKYFRMNLKDVKSRTICPIFRCVPDFCDVIINMMDLIFVTEYCSNIKKLSIQLQFNVANDKNLCSGLPKLQRLKELHIKSDKLLYLEDVPLQMLADLIKNTKTIASISFEDFYFTGLASDIEGCGYNIFRDIIKKAEHIKCWKFIHTFSNIPNIFELPSSVTSIVVKNCNYHYINLKHAMIKELIIDSTYNYYLNPTFQLENLSLLEVNNISLRSLSKSNLVLPKLETLKLRGTQDTCLFLQTYEPMLRSSLKELYLKSVKEEGKGWVEVRNSYASFCRVVGNYGDVK